MSRILLDTSAYSAIQRGDSRLRSPVQHATSVYLTSVVLGELLAGFRQGGRDHDNRALLSDFLASQRVEVLSVDEETADRYAAIRDYLRGQGQPIPTNDLWIAASAVQHGLRILTLDDHFRRVPHILVEYFEPSGR